MFSNSCFNAGLSKSFSVWNNCTFIWSLWRMWLLFRNNNKKTRISSKLDRHQQSELVWQPSQLGPSFLVCFVALHLTFIARKHNKNLQLRNDIRRRLNTFCTREACTVTHCHSAEKQHSLPCVSKLHLFLNHATRNVHDRRKSIFFFRNLHFTISLQFRAITWYRNTWPAFKIRVPISNNTSRRNICDELNSWIWKSTRTNRNPKFTAQVK